MQQRTRQERSQKLSHGSEQGVEQQVPDRQSRGHCNIRKQGQGHAMRGRSDVIFGHRHSLSSQTLWPGPIGPQRRMGHQQGPQQMVKTWPRNWVISITIVI